MPIEAEVIYRSKEEVLNNLFAAIIARIPDVYLGEDGTLRLVYETLAGEIEGLYLAAEIVRDNIFIQRANIVELQLHGEMYGILFLQGTLSTGTLLFSAVGGTFIPTGSVVGADPGAGEIVYFVTTADATIPNPGIPTAPTVADGGAGAIIAGTYEYGVAFVTADGESTLGAISAPIVLASSRQNNLTVIPLGGAGTTQRKIYRSKDGADFKLAVTIANNTATTVTDNTAEGALGAVALEVSTAERISVAGASEESGVEANVAIGTIDQVIEVPDGVTAVTNTTSFAGGSDDEDPESFRQRLLEFVRNPRTGSKQDLETWAEQISGVDVATAFSNDNLGTPTNGHATVRISGPNGAIPSGAVIAEVQAYLESKDIANITLHVGTFTLVTTAVTVDATAATGYTLAQITASVQTAVANYINGLGVGQTIYRSGIIDAVFGLPGVENVTVTTPGADVTHTATQKPGAGAVTVT